MTSRYAIYFMPDASSALWQFGSHVLGYDAAKAAIVPQLEVDGLDMAALTKEPCSYGFHATLKAPFRLNMGQDAHALSAALADFAKAQTPFVAGDLAVTELGDFLAFCLRESSVPLQELAVNIVETFEPFRAPLTEADIAKRLRALLTTRQMDYLKRYGYPYVLEEFVFHMSLSGALPQEARQKFCAVLRASYANIAKPLVIDGMALFCQDFPDAPFYVMERFAFGN